MQVVGKATTIYTVSADKGRSYMSATETLGHKKQAEVPLTAYPKGGDNCNNIWIVFNFRLLTMEQGATS